MEDLDKIEKNFLDSIKDFADKKGPVELVTALSALIHSNGLSHNFLEALMFLHFREKLQGNECTCGKDHNKETNEALH